MRRHLRYERDMQEPVLRWMQAQGLLVRTECATPWGICDLIGVSFAKRPIARRLALRQRAPIGSQLSVAVLSTLPDVNEGKTTSLRNIQATFGGLVARGDILRELDRLTERRFVQWASGGYQKLNGWMPMHRRIVSVELKLDRIEEAFRQASSHTGFSTESYVCLPLDTARRVQRSERSRRFLGAGVGLIGLGDSRVEILVRSRVPVAATIPWLQIHTVERFWRMGQKQLSISGSAIDSGRRVAPSSFRSPKICLP